VFAVLQRTIEIIRNLPRKLFSSALWFSSFQFGAIAFVILACVCVVGTQVFSIRNERAKEIAHARARAADLARGLARQAGDTFRLADISLIGVVKRLESEGPGIPTLDGLQPILHARIKAFPALAGFLITDETGKCLAVEPGPIPEGCSLSGRPNFEYLRGHADEEPRLSPPLRGPVTGRWVLALSRRFNHPDGSFAGTVVVSVNIRFFRDYYDTFDIGSNGAILLAMSGDDPLVVVRRPYIETDIGRSLRGAALLRAIAANGPVGEVELRASTDGVQRLNAYRQLESFPLVIAVGLARDDVLADWRASASSRIRTSAGLVAVIAALGVWLALHIRTRRHVEDAYRETAAAFRLLAENSTDLIVRLDANHKRVYVSPACRSLFGYDPEEMLAQDPVDMVHPEDRERWSRQYDRGTDESMAATFRAFRKDGSVLWVEGHRRRLAADGGFVVTIRDVTQRKATEDRLADLNRQLESIANHDALTGLANRRQFDASLAVEFRRARREGTTLCLVMLDVDRFKRFNDRYGHPAGDRCLQQIAGALKRVPRRPSDVVARYGGEEIALILPNTSLAGAAKIADRVREAVRSLAIPHSDNEFEVVTVSLGVAATNAAIDAPAKLVESADQALYAAKESGRDRVCVASKASAAQAAD
jgi:diguanylate cyclase (GGDEF)-like protein/PAS domain S-box-containing protein